MATGAALAAFAGARIFEGFIADGREAARVSRITAAAIKSTGGAAHVTAKQVDAMASRIMKLTGIDDETIKSGENMLLTFRNIRDETGKGNAIFDRATSILTDMTAALHGGDVSAEGMRKQAIQLGKALNDPVKGMTALTRVGVTFTDGQKKQVARLVASGHALDAQKLILRELGKEFGGTARAAADPMKRLKASLGEVGEAVGGKLLGPLNTAVTFIQFKAMPLVGAWAARWGHDAAGISRAVLPKFKPITDFLHGLVSGPAPVIPLPRLAGHVPVVPGPKFQVPLPQLPGHVPVLRIPAPDTSAAEKAGQRLRTLLSNLFAGKGFTFRGLGAALGRAMGDALEWISVNAGQFTEKLVKAMAGLDWVAIGKAVGGKAIGFAIGFVGSLGSDLFSADFWKKHWWDVILGVLAVFGAGKFGGAIAKVLEHIPVLKMFAPLFRGLEKIADPVWKAAGAIVKALGRGFLDGFKAVFPHVDDNLYKELGVLPTRIGVWGIKVFQACIRFGKGIGRGVITGAEKLGSIIAQIIGRMVKPYADAGTWLVRHGIEFVSGLLSGVRSRFGDVTRIAGSVIGRVRAPFAQAATWLLKAGGSIVHGLLTGIRNYMAGIGSWIKGNIVDPVISAVKHFFGISSPSTVMASIGGHLVSGLIRGMIRANPVAMVTRVFGSMPKALGALVGKGLVDLAKLPGKALRALGGLGGWLGHLFGFGGGGGSGVGRWSGLVLKVLGMLHQSPSWLPVVLRRMNQESGGNPNAINLTDINAQMGDPSRGLMQTIGATFNAYAGPFRGLGIYNPLANIYAGLNYALHRYGSLAALARPGGYARGGLITEPIFGVGRSGRSYTFGEKGTERVTPGAGPAGDRELIEAVRAIPDRTAALTAAYLADVLNSVGRRSAHAAAWSGGSW